MSRSLKSQVLRGTMWTVAAQIGTQAAHFVLSVVLARLLLPEDFGIVGMVMVFAGFATWIGDMGLAAALIQRAELEEKHTRSVFWLNMATGVAFTLIMFAAAPLIARFYDQPPLLPLTRAISFTFLFPAAGMVPAALLQRQMRFRYLARTSIIGTVLSGMTGIVLAYMGAGVWSLVAQMYIYHLATTLLNTLWAGWRPRWGFSRQAIKDLWRYSVNLLGYSSVNYWARNADSLLIGRLLGSASLGYYSRAYALMLFPLQQIVNVIGRVMFPALSSIQDDSSRVKHIYLQALSVIAFIVSPMMVGLAATAKPFVVTVYGGNWTPMIPLLQILPLVGLLQAFTGPSGWIFMSQGRTDWMFRWELVTSSAMIIGILIGIAVGTLEAIAWFYAAANVILFYPSVAIPGGLIGLSFKEVVRVLAGPLIGSTLMMAGVTLVGSAIPPSWPSIAELLLLVFVGALIYGIFVIGLRPAGWLILLALIEGRFPLLGARLRFSRVFLVRHVR